MPVRPTHPGVYIQEEPSGVRAITGVATSITAFVGYTVRGLDNRAKRLFSFADFERSFGGLAPDSELSYAVGHFFDNGGSEAYVVRVPKDGAAAATIKLKDGINLGSKEALKIEALSKGEWANNVLIDVDYEKIPNTDTQAFNLTITDLSANNVERFSNVTMDRKKSNFVETVVNDVDNGSRLVKAVVVDKTSGRPVQSGTEGKEIDLTKLDNKYDYKIKISSDLPATEIKDVEVTVIKKTTNLGPGDVVPGSVRGVCSLVQRNINSALQEHAATKKKEDLSGARVLCVPSSSGKGIRIQADFSQNLLPSTLDASLSFTAGATNNALSLLGLDGVQANVGHYWLGKGRTALAQSADTAGKDGDALPKTQNLIGKEADFTGIYALDKIDLFNILCIPDATRADPSDPNKADGNVDPNEIFGAAMEYCKKRRAFLLIDPPPDVNNTEKATDWISSRLKVHDLSGAAYFPRLRMADPLNDFKLRTFAPCGVVAGLYARTDADRGVWKAPAGTEARLNRVQGMVYNLTDAENGALNPLGLNCFRIFPTYGSIAWGARTLVGSDSEASEWKYIPVRRLALFLEETLYRALKWVVFEPNDEPLWAQIRLNTGAFMHGLFRQGAFQGKTPRDAYFVKCDSETTTQNDINLGIVHIWVGFAPLKPAEFVILHLQQMAGQVQV